VSLTGNFNPISSSTPAGVLNLGATITKDGSNNLTSVVGLLDKFGTARTIASPRLHAMNNQQAVMTVAQNKVYFTVQAQDATSSSTSASGTPTTTSSITSTLHTVPIGIIMTLEPSINLETNEVTMNIRPTLTTTTTSVDDPAVALTSQKNISSSSSTKSQPVTSSIPIIDVRELDSVMKLKSGEVMVMGGLMKSDVTNQDAGVPGVSKIPFFGNAFKSVVKTNNTVETVIFIKATIIPSDGMVVKADKALYKNFFRDPRPLAF
jgi:general secretion pathway protein D